MKPLFRQRTSPFSRLAFFAVLSIALMVADHRYQAVEALRDALSTGVAPLRYAVNVPAEAFEWISARLATRDGLIDRVAHLEAVNRRLRVRQQKFEILRRENERLRSLLHSSTQRQERVRIAELLAVDLAPFRQQIVLNQGASSGVYIGQPVVDAQGVMGQIIHVSPFTSTALLISDPSHALPVLINRNGLRTIAVGTGEPDRLKLLYILNSADIRIGDLVITSGLGGNFPANYPVATVTRVKRMPGKPFAQVIARPLADLEQSREVLLVWPEGRHESPGQGRGRKAAGERARHHGGEAPS